MSIVPEPICSFEVQSAGKAVALTAAGVAKADGSAYRWLHFDRSTEGLEPWLRAHLPAASVDALLQAETRPRSDGHDGGLIVNLRGVNLNPESDPEDMVSLRLWVTGDLVVSVRLRKIWAVDEMRQRVEAGQAPGTTQGLLAAIADGLTRRIETVVIALEERTDALEEDILGESVGEVAAHDLTGCRRTVIKLRRFINPQREALSALAEGRDMEFSRQDRAQMRETANRSARNVEALDTMRERLMILQDHLDTQQARAMSRNSYLLSVIAAVFLPLGFLTGLFGVNVAGMPGVEASSAFWVLSGVSAVLGVVLFAVFKLSRWL